MGRENEAYQEEIAPFTAAEFAACGYCLKGQRAVCAQVGVDYRDFIRNGLPYARAVAIPEIENMVNDVMKRRERGA